MVEEFQVKYEMTAISLILMAVALLDKSKMDGFVTKELVEEPIFEKKFAGTVKTKATNNVMTGIITLVTVAIIFAL
jgi:hypothetical protein